ncbi:MAG: hypothetical protein HYY24_16325 [Verrucomicrobia bacterium]|nr:hypothetical protein [Verrucomicrobiota bacterium]
MNPPTVSQGSLSQRIPTRRIAIESIVAFLSGQLEDFPTWRGTRPDQNEDYYNQRLDRFLNVRARKHLDAFGFSRETEYQTPGRHDIGVFPSEEEGFVVKGRTLGCDEPIYTLECKRLPQPNHRQREYLTSEAGEKPRGAVQRYKLCIHGTGLDAAGIIGYVQKGNVESWRRMINGWVGELVAKPVDNAQWTESDRLKSHSQFQRLRNPLISRSKSVRVQGPNIALTHFLVDLRAPTQRLFGFDEDDR